MTVISFLFSFQITVNNPLQEVARMSLTKTGILNSISNHCGCSKTQSLERVDSILQTISSMNCNSNAVWQFCCDLVSPDFFPIAKEY